MSFSNLQGFWYSSKPNSAAFGQCGGGISRPFRDEPRCSPAVAPDMSSPTGRTYGIAMYNFYMSLYAKNQYSVRFVWIMDLLALRVFFSLL